MSELLSNTTTDIVHIPLAQLHVSDGDQVRVKGINQTHVNELKEALAETPRDEWPKPLVTPWSSDPGDGYAVLGGNHTIVVAEGLGLEAMVCRVIPNGDWEAAFEDNRLHGLGPSSEDKKLHARRLADRYPDMSYREIGRRSGLSDKTVKRALNIHQEASAAEPRRAPDPLDRWLRQTNLLDEPPSATSISDEIADYDAGDRVDVATFYAAIGEALIDAAAPYLEED